MSFTSQQLEVIFVNSKNWLGSYSIVRTSLHIIFLIETATKDCTSVILDVDTFTFHHSVSARTVIYSKVVGFRHLVLLLDLLGHGAGLALHMLAKLASCGPTTESTLSGCCNRRRLNGLTLGQVFWRAKFWGKKDSKVLICPISENFVNNKKPFPFCRPFSMFGSIVPVGKTIFHTKSHSQNDFCLTLLLYAFSEIFFLAIKRLLASSKSYNSCTIPCVYSPINNWVYLVTYNELTLIFNGKIASYLNVASYPQTRFFPDHLFQYAYQSFITGFGLSISPR